MAHVSREPARSGAPQFALWASADDRYDTLSRVRTHGEPMPSFSVGYVFALLHFR